MDITQVFPSLRVFMGRLAPPTQHERNRRPSLGLNRCHTKKGPGRKHQQGKVKQPVSPFEQLAALAGA